MKLTLHVWRQKSRSDTGRVVAYQVDDVSPDMSFLELLDVLNERLIGRGDEPIAFDHDCREGICGSCGLMINGIAHGPEGGTTTCQLHMRSFKDGDQIWVEPWKARAFPIIKDLVVDRSAFDRIIQAGGFVGVNTGNAPDANAIPIPKVDADAAFEAAACIGCGACVASCKNAAAMLFVGAKVAHLNRLPQGRVESEARVQAMTAQMEREGFGNCTNQYECEAVCPKDIKVDVIAELNRLHAKATLRHKEAKEESGGM
jgi:succinate dehydrogenase / fumarate reductase iron-sulfur subunit